MTHKALRISRRPAAQKGCLAISSDVFQRCWPISLQFAPMDELNVPPNYQAHKLTGDRKDD